MGLAPFAVVAPRSKGARPRSSEVNQETGREVHHEQVISTAS
jgi:hypothetical protein